MAGLVPVVLPPGDEAVHGELERVELLQQVVWGLTGGPQVQAGHLLPGQQVSGQTNISKSKHSLLLRQTFLWETLDIFENYAEDFPAILLTTKWEDI